MNIIIENLMKEILLNTKAVKIHDVDKGEEAFKYASGNYGPGYISIKGLVGRKDIFKPLCFELAKKIYENDIPVDFVAGNATGGMTPGWVISEDLENLTGRQIPYVYIRALRKKGGEHDLITGIKDNPLIPVRSPCIDVEELVNFAETTRKGVEALREEDFICDYGACILFYDNPEAIRELKKEKITEIYLLTLPELLNVAETYQTHPQHLIESYRNFLKDPLGWQKLRGIEPDVSGGTQWKRQIQKYSSHMMI